MSDARTLALLGDSILDNAPYTRPRPDTTRHLRELLAPEWTVTRVARDGAVIADVRAQLSELPRRTDVVILSAGGNDAAEHIDLLDRRVSHSAEVLSELADIADGFAARYAELAAHAATRVERLVVCTIYEPPLFDPLSARLARVPLGILNDRIVRVATQLQLDVLDLRSVCTETSDFVQQIEPSAAGARKIAVAIAALIRGTNELISTRVLAQTDECPSKANR
jgi:lysophospholipase L1-like esterase